MSETHFPPLSRKRTKSNPFYLPKESLLTSTGAYESKRFHVGFAHSPGRKVDQYGRHVMEDVLFIECSFRDKEDEDLFIVLDGHNGQEAAKLVGQKFESILKEQLDCTSKLSLYELSKLSESLKVEVTSPELNEKNLMVAVALHLSFKLVTEQLKQYLTENKIEAGTTVLVCLILGEDLYITNVGDTRAVLVNQDGRAEQVSVDHKPINQEKRRIEESGGTIISTSVPRVEGILAVSRAIGNFDLEDKGIIWVPHTRVIPSFLRDAWFIILASDGLWDYVKTQEAAEIVDDFFYGWKEDPQKEENFQFQFEENLKPQKEKTTNAKQIGACTKLVDTAYQKNAVDNIGIILIEFNCK